MNASFFTSLLYCVRVARNWRIQSSCSCYRMMLDWITVAVTLFLISSCDFLDAEWIGIGGSSQVPFQFLETLNQEDLAFRVFLLQTAESSLLEVVCSPFLPSLPPAHLLINPLAEVRSRPPLLLTYQTHPLESLSPFDHPFINKSWH